MPKVAPTNTPAVALTIASPAVARSRLSGWTSRHPDDHAELRNRRRDLAAANIQAAIDRIMDSAPPLTTAQAEALASVLRRNAEGAR